MDRLTVERGARLAFAGLLVLWVLARLRHTWAGVFRPFDEGFVWRVYYILVPSPGGPVRRGLLGELLLVAVRIWSLDPRSVILVVFTALTLLVALGLWSLGRGRPLPALGLFAAPAGLAFDVLEPGGVVRHDILLLGTAVGFSLLLRAGRYRGALLWATVASAVWPFLHEGLALFVPWLLLAWFADDDRPCRLDRAAVAAVLLPLAAGLAVIAFATHARAGPALVEAICAELRAAAPALPGMDRCESLPPIAYHARTIAVELRAMLSGFAQRLATVLPATVLSVFLLLLAWVAAGGTIEQLVLRLRRIPGWFAPLLGLPALLFAVATESGRWVHAAYTLLTVVLLQEGRAERPAEPVGTIHPGALMLVLLQPALWRIELFGAITPTVTWLVAQMGSRSLFP